MASTRPNRTLIPSPSIVDPQDKVMIIRRTEIDQFRSLMTSGNIRLLLEKDKCFNYIDNYLLATGENIIILIMVTVFISSESHSHFTSLFLSWERKITKIVVVVVLVYFKRCNLSLSSEYTADNFWKLLYLAHDQVMVARIICEITINLISRKRMRRS